MPPDTYIEKEKSTQDAAKFSKDSGGNSRSLENHDEMDLSGTQETEKASEMGTPQNWSKKFNTYLTLFFVNYS